MNALELQETMDTMVITRFAYCIGSDSSLSGGGLCGVFQA